MDNGFDAKDAALLLGKTNREISRLLRSRPATGESAAELASSAQSSAG